MLLSTKFHRPTNPSDLVVRTRLFDKLNQGLNQPLTVICAPAGYGKTILASSFLTACPRPSAWISIDEDDNQLHKFLEYFLSAINSLFPGSVFNTQLLLEGLILPSVSAIADSLINELAELDDEFILVLDDLHWIHEIEIFRFLDALLKHPLKNIHLMLITRHELMMNLGSLRARGQMNEVRLEDLRFSVLEIAAFFKLSLNISLYDKTLMAFAKRTEGWITGLRLASITLRSGSRFDELNARLYIDNQYVMDYLMKEVLNRIPLETYDFLVKTSILDRFCAPLCEAIVDPEGVWLRGQAMLHDLENLNLFIIPLDEKKDWYRYHHLFQQILKNELREKFNPQDVDALHIRASEWYARQGSIEPAIKHALAGNDMQRAVQLLVRQRHHLLNSEQRPRLERYLRHFLSETISQHADLLLSKVWINMLGRVDDEPISDMLAKAQNLVNNMSGQPELARQLQGEINVLYSIGKNFAANDPEGVINLTSEALDALPKDQYFQRSEAWLHHALAYQMIGELDRAEAIFAIAKQEDFTEGQLTRGRIITASCFVYWIAADLQNMVRAAQACRVYDHTSEFQDTLGWKHYFLASVYYQWNDLAAAEQHAKLVEELRYSSHPTCVLHSAFILAAAQQARGLPEQARQTLDWAYAFMEELRSEPLLPVHGGFKAELALAQGDLYQANRWLATMGPLIPHTLMAFFYTPQLTYSKILLAINTPSSRQQASQALSELGAFVTATHNTRFTIDVLALQALLHDAQGDEQAALQTLEKALALAEPGYLVRVFVDMGPKMSSLLKRLARRGIATDFIAQVLASFDPEPSLRRQPLFQPGLVESLTYREFEILNLLGDRLSDKEIAQQLTISPATVKRHNANIYGKLGVSNRRQAVDAAIALGLLTDQR